MNLNFIILPAILLAAVGSVCAGSREDFLALIGRPRVPLAPISERVAGNNGLLHESFSFAAEAGERVPGIVIRAKADGRRPVVVVLHGTGGNKEGEIPLLQTLAGKGFLAVAIDGRWHGARSPAGKGSGDYSSAILRTYRTGQGHPFLYDTVWDILRLIDYLETRPDVDARRIGLIGFSKGGMETYLAAAVDPRIAVAVPCIGVQSFRWALEHDAWQSRVGTFQAAMDAAAKDAGAQVDAKFVRSFYDRVAPGVYSQFDGPSMLPLIAPRPLLSINGDSDARTPIPGLMECARAAEKAYAAAGVPDRFVLTLEKSTGHQVRPDGLAQAVEWLARWLEPALIK